MSIIEIILIGIGLAMDAFAVSVSNAMTFENLDLKKKLSISLSFGFFQALMPFLGCKAISFIAQKISGYSGIIVFIILMIIAIKMLYDGIKGDEGECKNKFTYSLLLVQAFATSIDALAVGVGFSLKSVNIYVACLTIGVTTFILSSCGLFLGRKFGKLLGNKALIVGSVILMAVAVKALF